MVSADTILEWLKLLLIAEAATELLLIGGITTFINSGGLVGREAC